MATDTAKMPKHLYVQRGVYNGLEEVVCNQTPEGALRRDLGPGGKPGEVVGVYVLQQVVRIGVGLQELPAAPPHEVISQPGTTASA